MTTGGGYFTFQPDAVPEWEQAHLEQMAAQSALVAQQTADVEDLAKGWNAFDAVLSRWSLVAQGVSSLLGWMNNRFTQQAIAMGRIGPAYFEFSNAVARLEGALGGLAYQLLGGDRMFKALADLIEGTVIPVVDAFTQWSEKLNFGLSDLHPATMLLNEALIILSGNIDDSFIGSLKDTWDWLNRVVDSMTDWLDLSNLMMPGFNQPSVHMGAPDTAPTGGGEAWDYGIPRNRQAAGGRYNTSYYSGMTVKVATDSGELDGWFAAAFNSAVRRGTIRFESTGELTGG